MRTNFYDQLPRNYFDNLYGKVVALLFKGENVCVSAFYGCGGKSFYQLFVREITKDKLFSNITYFDPELEKESLPKFAAKQVKKNNGPILVVIRLFEKIPNKQEILEKLLSLQQSCQKRIIYLVITDHTAFSTPEQYFAKTASFFSGKLLVTPFNNDQTREMINLTKNYFGWDINKELYKEIYSLSGGIPRLVKYICKGVSEQTARIIDTNKFLEDPAVRFQLVYLSQLLITLETNILIKLELIDEELKIKSKLLEIYFKNYSSQSIRELLPELSDMELAAASFLYENKGRVVSIDKLQDCFELAGVKTTIWGIYKLIFRLNNKICKYFQIKNVKGKGYLLVN